MEESVEPPSPTGGWLGEKALFVDCFGEAVGREKLDRADIIAVSVYSVCVCVWGGGGGGGGGWHVL